MPKKTKPVYTCNVTEEQVKALGDECCMCPSGHLRIERKIPGSRNDKFILHLGQNPLLIHGDSTILGASYLLALRNLLNDYPITTEGETSAKDGQMKHTPGPWSACQNGQCSCGIIWGGGEYPIAEVQSGEWGDSYPALRVKMGDSLSGKADIEAYMELIPYGMGATKDEAAANARLIAAAPEMLEALLSLVTFFDDLHAGPPLIPEKQAIYMAALPRLNQAQEAISKALEGVPEPDKPEYFE
ncbi:MAG: hypothetical protein WC551_11580 [Patescibacteria group bacterium]